jgi:hypothetical protein
MDNQKTKYQRAAKRVKQLKGFYKHLRIFVVVNLALYIFKSEWLQALLPNDFALKPRYFESIHANFFIWLTILCIHAIVVYLPNFKFLRLWEERQIQKYMEEENHERDKFY